MSERTIPTIRREFKHGSCEFSENCDEFWINDHECMQHNSISHMAKRRYIVFKHVSMVLSQEHSGIAVKVFWIKSVIILLIFLVLCFVY